MVIGTTWHLQGTSQQGALLTHGIPIVAIKRGIFMATL